MSKIQSIRVFGGGLAKFSTREFEGGRMVSIIGAADVDMREVQIKGEEAVLSVIVFAGSIALFVPPTWDVTLRTINIAGVAADTHRGAVDPTGPRQRLVVKGITVAGSLRIV